MSLLDWLHNRRVRMNGKDHDRKFNAGYTWAAERMLKTQNPWVIMTETNDRHPFDRGAQAAFNDLVKLMVVLKTRNDIPGRDFNQ